MNASEGERSIPRVIGRCFWRSDRHGRMGQCFTIDVTRNSRG